MDSERRPRHVTRSPDMTPATRSYECNTATRTFRGTARQVATVALSWQKRGETVGAYAILSADDMVTVREVAITSAKATAAALATVV